MNQASLCPIPSFLRGVFCAPAPEDMTAVPAFQAPPHRDADGCAEEVPLNFTISISTAS